MTMTMRMRMRMEREELRWNGYRLACRRELASGFGADRLKLLLTL